MTRLMVYTTSITVFTVSIAVFTASAELHQNTLTSGYITIEYILQDDGTRLFVESEPTSVDPKEKVTTTWAAIKS